MTKQHTIKSLILFLAIIESVHCFEIFIKNKDDGNKVTIEHLKNVSKTYEIPLFQTRYITIKMSPNDLDHNRNVIGFKFQVQSTDIRVVDIQKEIMVPTKITNRNNSNNILLEDLFICKLIMF
jgi:hypothetical protein